jgi:chromosome segregation protein
VLRQAEQLRAQSEAGRSQAGTTLDSLAQEREYLLGELGRINSESRAMHEAAQISEQAKGEEEERVRQLGASLDEKRARMEETKERLHAARIRLTQLAGMDQAERTAHSALFDALSEKRAQAEERRRRKARYEERSGVLAEVLEAGRSAIEDAAAELSRLQEKIDRQLGETSAVSALQESLEGALKTERRRETEARERLTELRLSVLRVENDLANLDTLTWQRYETHPAELPAPETAGDPEAVAGELGEWESRAGELRERIAGEGDVNLASIEEHRELSERTSFLSSQKEDLEKSLEDLAKAIQRINRTTRERFSEAFEKINEKLQEVFPKLFQGGRAFLTLLEEENLLDTGVEIVVQPPGKKLLPLKSLSGGEKSLAAASLIFSIFLVKPSPFCLLDEADTALDDANIDRFNGLVREMSANYQFLLITHNKRTMELADCLYGITMEKPGISKVVSVKFNA